MVTTICSVIGSLLGIISILLNLWMAGGEKRRENEIQKGRRDIVDGNVDAVEQRIDELLTKNSGHIT